MNMGLSTSDRRRGALAVVAAFAGASVLAACSSDAPGQKSGTVAASDASVAEDAGVEAPPRDPCAQAAMGFACGTDKHCIAARCVFNTCGDGVKAGDEACDDGNEAIGDGCDPACKSEPKGCGNAKLEMGEECDDGNRVDQDACSNGCQKNECGNLRVDINEECDDGNAVDDDKCSNKCLIVRCRNGRVDPGEQCDDGNQIDDDGCSNKCLIKLCGNGKQEEGEECDDGNRVDDDKCSNRCTENKCGNMRVDPGEQCDGSLACDDKCVSKPDMCTPCEEMHCRDFMGLGLDLVAGCLEDNPSPEYVPKKPAPGEFTALCKSVVSCARVNHCVHESTFADSCYCGSATADECTGMGPAADAKCVIEYQKALGATENLTLTERLGDPSYAGGYATVLLQCDVLYCKKECTPWLP
jgi:cysteine-rich repeat protein